MTTILSEMGAGAKILAPIHTGLGDAAALAMEDALGDVEGDDVSGEEPK